MIITNYCQDHLLCRLGSVPGRSDCRQCGSYKWPFYYIHLILVAPLSSWSYGVTMEIEIEIELRCCYIHLSIMTCFILPRLQCDN